ncbi:MAG: hypothetical protein EKK42_10455 [Pseudonocardiaceae bacterium]|nr:MAG: hypothetical protein EKK42_10455 [Pseudonocardiaceae bacterium]
MYGLRVKYDEAQRWLAKAGPYPDSGEPSLVEQLDRLKELAAKDALPHSGIAVWYALVQEMRRLADYYERDLIRGLRSDGMTWAQVAHAVEAQLSSRQAAHAKWKRLIDPGRRTTTGDMRRGGRPKDPPALSPGE